MISSHEIYFRSVDVCKDMISENCDVTVEDIAMNRVLLRYLQSSFVSAGKVKEIRDEMALAAFSS